MSAGVIASGRCGCATQNVVAIIAAAKSAMIFTRGVGITPSPGQARLTGTLRKVQPKRYGVDLGLGLGCVLGCGDSTLIVVRIRSQTGAAFFRSLSGPSNVSTTRRCPTTAD